LAEQTVFLFSKVKDVFNTIDTSGSGRLGHQDVSYLRVLVLPSLCHPHFLSLMSCCVCDDSGMLASKSASKVQLTRCHTSQWCYTPSKKF